MAEFSNVTPGFQTLILLNLSLVARQPLTSYLITTFLLQSFMVGGRSFSVRSLMSTRLKHSTLRRKDGQILPMRARKWCCRRCVHWLSGFHAYLSGTLLLNLQRLIIDCKADADTVPLKCLKPWRKETFYEKVTLPLYLFIHLFWNSSSPLWKWDSHHAPGGCLAWIQRARRWHFQYKHSLHDWSLPVRRVLTQPVSQDRRTQLRYQSAFSCASPWGRDPPHSQMEPLLLLNTHA